MLSTPSTRALLTLLLLTALAAASTARADYQFDGASRREGYDTRYDDRRDYRDRYDRGDDHCDDDRDVYIYNQYNYPDRRYSYENDQRYPTHRPQSRHGGFYGERPSSYAPGFGSSFPARPARASRPFWR